MTYRMVLWSFLFGALLAGSAPRAVQTNGVVSCAADSPGYWVSGTTGEETFQLFDERCPWVDHLKRLRAGESLLDSKLPVRLLLIGDSQERTILTDTCAALNGTLTMASSPHMRRCALRPNLHLANFFFFGAHFPVLEGAAKAHVTGNEPLDAAQRFDGLFPKWIRAAFPKQQLPTHVVVGSGL